MEVVTLLTVAVLVGWLATLIMNARIETVCLFDFAIAVTGATLAGGLLARWLGISTTSEYGLTLRGTLISWAGAMTLLAVVNLLRYGRPRRERRRSTTKRAPLRPPI